MTNWAGLAGLSWSVPYPSELCFFMSHSISVNNVRQSADLDLASLLKWAERIPVGIRPPHVILK